MEWTSPELSDRQCLEIVHRAAEKLESRESNEDICRRLGIPPQNVVTAMAVVGRVDGDPTTDGNTKYPCFVIDPKLLKYLSLDRLHPDLKFRWTLGLFRDHPFGIIPAIFIVTQYQNVTRVACLPWSHVLGRDRDFLKLLLKDHTAPNSSDTGAEGGFALISKIAIIVDGPWSGDATARSKNGLDFLTTSQIIPWKIWDAISNSVHHGAISNSFDKSAPVWPYPVEFKDHGILSSDSAAKPSGWY